MNTIPIIQLFKKGNPLKTLVLFFIFLQALWTFIGIQKSIECSPFFLYGMYSDIYKKQQFHNSFLIYINDTLLDMRTVPYWEKEYVLNNIRYYAALKDSTGKNPSELIIKSGACLPKSISGYFKSSLLNAPAQVNEFPAWLKKYTGTILQKKVNTIKVKQALFRFEDQPPIRLTEKTLFEI